MAYSFGVALLTTLGFVFFSICGGYVGFSVGVLIAGMIFILGDRFLLALFRVVPANVNDSEVAAANNVSCRLGIERVHVYYSDSFSNMYALEGICGAGKVIIGRKLYEICSSEEIRVLLFSAILRIKNKEIRYIQTISLMAALFSIPRYLLNVFKKTKVVRFVQMMFQFYELPIFTVKQMLTNNSSKRVMHDRDVVRLTGEQEVYAAGLFKIMNNLENCAEQQYPAFDELGVITKEGEYGTPSKLIMHAGSVERYERLQ